MGRPARFDSDLILDAAARLIARDGAAAATATAVARELGAPSGSIYHRFPSRDVLVATLWTRAARRFQEGFLATLSLPDVIEASDAAALYTPVWCRAHLDEACVLLLHRSRDLAAAWPDELGGELDDLGRRLEDSIRSFARRRLGTARAAARERVALALIDIPYGAVHRHLVDRRPPPPAVDSMIVAASRTVLGSRPEG